MTRIARMGENGECRSVHSFDSVTLLSALTGRPPRFIVNPIMKFSVRNSLRVPLFCLFCLVFCSCGREEVPEIVREDLFSLEIGMLEDQIALFSLEGGAAAVDMIMREGFFYFSSGRGAKISRYTSYGDLLFMIYNDESNPPPLSLRSNVSGGEIVTRRAVSWPLVEPGRIAVDSRKHLFVEDRLPPERRVFDRENRALLDGMILHFDDSGRFIEYLGQEGTGGTPFPRINGLYRSLNDDLAVVCRAGENWIVYWFDAAGTKLFTIALKAGAVPVPGDRAGVIPSVDSIMAAPDRRQLFMKVDYYLAVQDESTGTPSGVEPDSSVIWIMDAETGAWTDSFEAPFYAPVSGRQGGAGQEPERLFYSMLGLARDGRVFLSLPVEGGYSILILRRDPSGRELSRRQGFIQVDDTELEYSRFSLSDEGILSALLATEYGASVAWWRTDRLAAELSP